MFRLPGTLLATAVLVATAPATAEVRLPSVLGDHAVLQRGRPVPIWGWAEPGEVVTVSLAHRRAQTVAGADGRWRVDLEPLEAGGPHTLQVNSLRVEDVLVGEVWVCAGQSNMDWELALSEDAANAVPAATDDGLRLFHVPREPAAHPQPDTAASWRPCRPEVAASFSAVAYCFGRELRERLGVPVGLVGASFGGTFIEAWTPAAGIESERALAPIVAAMEQERQRYRATLASQLDALDAWVADARAALDSQRPPPRRPPLAIHPLEDKDRPTALYNGMVAPVVPHAIAGVLWYQGEQNVGDGLVYVAKMRALVNAWRLAWDQGAFPFYYVQLAPYDYPLPADALPELREAQRLCLALPNVGMVVTTDIGNLGDIHPRNKREVGRRLALWARARSYGESDLVHSGPLFRDGMPEASGMRLRFDHVGGGLATRDGGAPSHFELAGDDGRFVPAQARIDGETVFVSSDLVARPVAVRMGWDQAAVPNLVNAEGLPAAPFRAGVDW